MKNIKLLLALLSIMGNLWAQPIFNSEPKVRVRIINTLDTLNATLAGGWSLKVEDSLIASFPDSSVIMITHSEGRVIVLDSIRIFSEDVSSLLLKGLSDISTAHIQDVPYGVGWWWAGIEDRIYEGDIHLYIDSDHDLCTTIQLPLETYLKGVVPYEIGPTSPLEALKAQAVAARSEAVIALTSKLYSGEHHDLTSDVECQVFSGNKRRSQSSDQAVDETRGLIISEKGQPMNAYYASNCGGRNELIKNVWPDRPRLESYEVSLPDNPSRKGPRLFRNWKAKHWIKKSPDVFCNPEFEPALPEWSRRNFRWERSFDIAELSAMLSGDQDFGLFKKVKVLNRGPSGRIYKAQFVFESGSYSIDGELAIRQLFSPSLRSSNFYYKRNGEVITLYGAGWGHGVGMCQSGAVAQASKGTGFEQILKHYYSKADLLNIYPEK